MIVKSWQQSGWQQHRCFLLPSLLARITFLDLVRSLKPSRSPVVQHPPRWGACLVWLLGGCLFKHTHACTHAHVSTPLWANKPLADCPGDVANVRAEQASRLCRAPFPTYTHLALPVSSSCTACRQYQLHVMRRKASFDSITWNLSFGNRAGAISVHGEENLICIWGRSLTSAGAGRVWSGPGKKRSSVSLGSFPSEERVGRGGSRLSRPAPLRRGSFGEKISPPRHAEEAEAGERRCPQPRSRPQASTMRGRCWWPRWGQRTLRRGTATPWPCSSRP